MRNHVHTSDLFWRTAVSADVAAWTAVRRRDRAVEDEGWIKDFLRRAPAGTLATVHAGQPFVNMNVFAYAEDEHAIYLHTARTGRTRANIEGSERVCFGVHTMGRLLPAVRAKEFSVEYAGVVVFGRGEVVADEAEARRALQRLLDKYFPHLRPGRDYRPITAEELAVTTVYRIRIDGWSGKQKVAPDDFPGAFRYGEPPPAPATTGTVEGA
jgi:nitroimidazol reductase NimA-like FMN-containing flavoprotein (pyridoxamine 5'-phosphate oxidase superfamily)